MFIINDTHIGVRRSGGTTPASAAALEDYAFEQLASLLDRAVTAGQSTVMVNGDLADSFDITNAAVLRTFNLFSAWLRRDAGRHLILSQGNHDIARDTSRVSAFQLLSELLKQAFTGQVTVVVEPLRLNDDIWIIPHAPNQDRFDLWLEDVVASPSRFVFVHANYDNNFAVEDDHSLNISAERAKELISAGVQHLIFGHVHQQAQHGKVMLVGNQFPTSVADCLGNDSKFAIYIENGLLKKHQTWQAAGSFFQVSWQQIDQVPDNVQFIRVAGEASDEQAGEALEAVSQLRKRHKAFVISNAVTVQGKAMETEALQAVEQLQSFNILDFLYANLNEPQVARLKALHGSKDHA